jgi:hypothetical protein
MAEGYHSAYKELQSRGQTVYSEEWRFAPEAEYFSPYFSGGKSYPMGQMRRHTPLTESASKEAKVYSAALPDWGPIEFLCFPSDIGFTTRTLYGGHTRDGALLKFHMIDFVLTNDEGLITRWDPRGLAATNTFRATPRAV